VREKERGTKVILLVLFGSGQHSVEHNCPSGDQIPDGRRGQDARTTREKVFTSKGLHLPVGRGSSRGDVE
jgi:hypothetical protein